MHTRRSFEAQEHNADLPRQEIEGVINSIEEMTLASKYTERNGRLLFGCLGLSHRYTALWTLNKVGAAG